MIWRVLRTLRHYPHRPAAIALAIGVLAWLTHFADRLHRVTDVLTITACSALAILTGWWVARWLAPAVSTGAWVTRRDDEAHHAGGVATWLDIGERASASVMRSKAR